MRRGFLTLVTGACLAGSVLAQPYGMGHGMMGGQEGHGMGAGMAMWGGYDGDALAGLDLSAQQRTQIAQIQEETAKARWQLMGTLHENRGRMRGGFGPAPLDEAAARKAFESMQATQKSMFELSLAARKRIEAVLTAEQRDQFRRHWSGRAERP